jgi:tetratricopeptide (TPR) repeat protein
MLALFSCQSLQRDRLVDISNEPFSRDIAELEEQIVPLDRDFSREGAAAVRRRITALEKNPLPDTRYGALLAALSGRLFILEGKQADAQKKLRDSQSLSPGNIQAVVLSLRLEKDVQRRLVMIDRELGVEAAGELQIERGRALMEVRRYREAAAAFDTAFSMDLKEVYRDTYRAARDRAWELRDAEAGTASKTQAIVEKDGLTWTDVIELTRGETELLRFLTAGRDWPTPEIFDRLLERSFIPFTQDVTVKDWPSAKPRAGEQVTRSGAAWYIWRLYADRRADRSLLTKYSAGYAARPGSQSPVADLPLLSPFFDSVLGCVETELMSLPDGRNFRGAEKVRGAEMLSILRKIR